MASTPTAQRAEQALSIVHRDAGGEASSHHCEATLYLCWEGRENDLGASHVWKSMGYSKLDESERLHGLVRRLLIYPIEGFTTDLPIIGPTEPSLRKSSLYVARPHSCSFNHDRCGR